MIFGTEVSKFYYRPIEIGRKKIEVNSKPNVVVVNELMLNWGYIQVLWSDFRLRRYSLDFLFLLYQDKR